MADFCICDAQLQPHDRMPWVCPLPEDFSWITASRELRHEAAERILLNEPEEMERIDG